MSNQHYAAFIKLTKQDVVEVGLKPRLEILSNPFFKVQKNAQSPGWVFPHGQGRLNRHPWMDW